MKKIILFVVVLGLAGAGFFYWWNNQADVRELNKTLPEGVKVVKSLFGNEYKVVNKIDGYEFKIPSEWKGIKEIEYIPEREAEEYKVASIWFENQDRKDVGVDVYKEVDTDLETWARELLDTFGLNGLLEKETIEGLNILKVKDEEYLGGTYVYFLKSDSTIIYVFSSGSEEFIHYIITNGKW